MGEAAGTGASQLRLPLQMEPEDRQPRDLSLPFSRIKSFISTKRSNPFLRESAPTAPPTNTTPTPGHCFTDLMTMDMWWYIAVNHLTVDSLAHLAFSSPVMYQAFVVKSVDHRGQHRPIIVSERPIIRIHQIRCRELIFSQELTEEFRAFVMNNARLSIEFKNIFDWEVGFYSCAHELLFTNCPLLTSLDPIKAVPVVRLQNLTLTDVTPLAHSSIVSIDSCPFVADLSALCDITELSLSTLQLTSIPVFTRLRFCSIVKCHQITSLENLHVVSKLTLEDCRQIQDYSCLRSATHLEITLPSSTALIDLAAYPLLDTLVLRGCPQMAHLNGIHSPQRVELTDMVNLVDVSALGRVKHIVLKNCPNLDDSSMGSFTEEVETVEFTRITVGLVAMGALKTAKAIRLIDCTIESTNLAELAPLANAQSVAIIRSNTVNDVTVLQNVPEVRLESLPALQTFNPLIQAGTSVKSLSVDNCQLALDATDLSEISRITKVELGRMAITNARLLAKVPVLALTECVVQRTFRRILANQAPGSVRVFRGCRIPRQVPVQTYMWE